MSAPAPVAGAVLAGGASRRFGSDKVLAPLAGRPLLEWVAAALRAAGADPVAAVGGAGREGLGLVPVADEHPGEGPLAGIAAALTWCPADHVVVVASDLPLLDEPTLRALVARARRRPRSVAVARAGGRLQPVCACWPAALAPRVRARFAVGERSVARLLAELEVEPVDVPARCVADVDTPGDLARLAGTWSR